MQIMLHHTTGSLLLLQIPEFITEKEAERDNSYGLPLNSVKPLRDLSAPLAPIRVDIRRFANDAHLTLRAFRHQFETSK